MSKLPVVPILLSLALAPACALEAPELGSQSQASSSSNALSDNRLSYNRLSYNRLSYNRLSYNRLSYNRLSYNGLDNDMHVDAEGREILRYIAKCALHEGDTLVVDSPDGTFEYAGLLGLAPEWEDGAIDVEAQEAITACLLAHVNKFGVSVPISVRHPNLACPASEEAKFTRFEGAFFGNIFDSEGAMYACRSGSSPNTLNTSMGDRLLRVCSDHACNAFLSLGRDCSSLCTLNEDGTFRDCATKSKRKSNTSVYSNPMQVWLLAANDNDAVWPEHLDLLEDYYGPEQSAGKNKNKNKNK